MTRLAYRRVLLKLSGEALLGDGSFGIDPGVLSRLADEVRELAAAGAELGLVIGGGNIFRGAGLAAAGMDRVTGDQLGMLATVMNALAMRDALESRGVPARVLSALRMEQVCETYTAEAARRHLAAGRVALFAAGTGNTADSHGDVCTRKMHYAIDHLLDDGIADGAMFLKGRVVYAEDRFLGAVGITDNAVTEHGRAASDIGHALCDPTTRAGFRRRDGLAGFDQFIDDRGREFFEGFVVSHVLQVVRDKLL